MLLTGYHKQLAWSECKSNYGLLQCIATLHDDITDVLPYLNAELGGYVYTSEPSVMFKLENKMIVIRPHEIAINRVKDEAEADEILEWFMARINEIWQKRSEITPISDTRPKPNVVEVLRILAGTNCRDCGKPSCVVYAAELVDGKQESHNCLALDEEARAKLNAYLSAFKDA